VASAVARNDIAWLIPCHRVIRATGKTGGYRWGSERKQLMIGWESARRSAGIGAGLEVPARGSISDQRAAPGGATSCSD
jgi:AraC family transcriptional regulator of adaptative response/methylated-DNA-[protein]-cysteine methyltransferase